VPGGSPGDRGGGQRGRGAGAGAAGERRRPRLTGGGVDSIWG